MSKKMGCLVVLLVLGGIGSLSIRRSLSVEQDRRAGLTPEQRAAEDSAAAERARTEKDSARARDQRDPVYQKTLAELALKKRARDPGSVEIRNQRVYTRGDTLVVCGEVNSKNGFGGYTGFKPFVSLRGVAVTEDDAKGGNAALITYMFSLCENR